MLHQKSKIVKIRFWRRISQSEIRKITAAKKEAAKARAGKNSFPPTPFLFARPSVKFWFCRAKRGNQEFFSKNVRAELYNSTKTKLDGFLRANSWVALRAAHELAVLKEGKKIF